MAEAEVFLNFSLSVDEWVARLMGHYTKLRPEDSAYGTGPVGWFWAQWRKQGGEFVVHGRRRIVTRAALCNISKVPLGLGGLHVPNCASVNNRNVALKGNENHEPQDCELISVSLNVAQQSDRIKSLKEAFHEVVQAAVDANRPGAGLAEQAFVEEVRRNWASGGSKALNGIDSRGLTRREYKRQCWDLDLRTIAQGMHRHHLKEDRLRGRANNLEPQHIYELLLLQRGRCFYSNGLMTIRNGPMRFSVERLDNRLGHVVGNCVLISRMLNSRAGTSRAHFLGLLRSYRSHEWGL